MRDARRQQRHSINDLRRDAFLTPQLALSQNAGTATGRADATPTIPITSSQAK
jgi:hypothetical protein